MTNSIRIAGLLGPTLTVIAVSEWINLPLMLNNPAPVVLVYLNGILLFVAGLAIIRAHSGWKDGWSALVTLIGWLAILGGLFRSFAPAFAQQHEQNIPAMRILLLILFAIGIFLAFKAYGRRDGEIAIQKPVTR